LHAATGVVTCCYCRIIREEERVKRREEERGIERGENEREIKREEKGSERRGKRLRE